MTYWLQLTILYCALKCFVKRIALMLSILTTKKRTKTRRNPKQTKTRGGTREFLDMTVMFITLSVMIVAQEHMFKTQRIV